MAWVLGYALLDLQPWTLAVPVGLGLAVGAVATTVLVRSRETRSGREARVGLGWWVVMACSPLLVIIVRPVEPPTVAIFLGSLWGVAMLLLATATRDLPLGVVGGAIVLGGAACRTVADLGHPLLVFGLVGGLGMLGLGLWRTWRSR